MEKSLMLKWAKQIIRESGFKKPSLFYSAEKGDWDDLRCLIYSGIYQGRSSVLKINDDPFRIAEPLNLISFNQENKSQRVIAPKVYAHKLVDATRNWFVMEKLPSRGSFFRSQDARKPLSKEERKEFIKVFEEYRKAFPAKPSRPLALSEKLPAYEFHRLRIHRWFELASDSEVNSEIKGKGFVLNTKVFFPQYFNALTMLDKEFKSRKMVWSHGHFKPKEIYYVPQENRYYLTDFAHVHMYPEGYELGFMIWADWLMAADWKLPYKEWKKGVDGWISDLAPVAESLKYKNPEQLLKASLVERILGAILADVTASTRPRKEKIAMLGLLTRLLKDLLK